MDVLLLTEEPSKIVIKNLIDAQVVGLTVYSDDNENIIILCISIEFKIYIAIPDNESHLKLLAKMLKNERIKFCTIDGMVDADLIKKNMGLSLKGQIDLPTFDIKLTIDFIIENSRISMQKNFTLKYILEKIRPKYRNYERLLEKKLKLTPNLEITVEEFANLKQLREASKIDPSSHNIALEAIKRRSGPVWLLARYMVDNFKEMRNKPSQLIYSFGARANDDTWKQLQKVDPRPRDKDGDEDYYHLVKLIQSCSEID